jgi:hypothetical protein
MQVSNLSDETLNTVLAYDWLQILAYYYKREAQRQTAMLSVLKEAQRKAGVNIVTRIADTDGAIPVSEAMPGAGVLHLNTCVPMMLTCQ